MNWYTSLKIDIQVGHIHGKGVDKKELIFRTYSVEQLGKINSVNTKYLAVSSQGRLCMWCLIVST